MISAQKAAAALLSRMTRNAVSSPAREPTTTDIFIASMAEHVEAGRSLELWADLSEASKVRREAEAPERWLSRVTEVVEATSRATARGE